MDSAFKRHNFVIAAALGLFISCGQAHSSSQTSFQSHADIIQQAESFIRDSINVADEDVAIKIKSLDRRLKLSQCSIPLETFWPPGASTIGHTSVGIRCRDNKPWKIFIGATIKKITYVWVATAGIPRGTILTENHINLEKREVNKMHTHQFDQNSSPIGLVAKRPIADNSIISSSALDKPIAVKRGDRVTVIARKNGLEIRSVAIAMNDAAEGDKIRVRNKSTKKEIHGILADNSTVYINI